MEDPEIIRLFWQRCETAIAAVREKYQRPCFSLSRNIVGNAQDAEEVLSDSWMALWNAIPPERPNPIRAYIFRIVRNLSLSKFRYNTAQKRGYALALDELEPYLPAKETLESILDRKECIRILNAFLAQLDRESRVLFVRRYWYGDEISTLAKAFGLRPNTVSARLSRIRKKLRADFIQEGVTV